MINEEKESKQIKFDVKFSNPKVNRIKIVKFRICSI